MKRLEKIKEAVTQNYSLRGIVTIEKIDLGFLSSNYRVSNNDKEFFLKGYRYSDIEKVKEIHTVKKFFASHGFPVILPLQNKTGKTITTIEDVHYALFPFVKGIHFNRGTIPDHIAKALGENLAMMHACTQKHPLVIKESFGAWSDSIALSRMDELIGIIENIKTPNAFDRLALASLKFKEDLVKKDGKPLSDFALEPYILLHGDYHEQNIFFDVSGKIKYIFDFEKATMGPRCFELWRSVDYMFLNGDFSDERISKAITYLKAYNAKNSISKEELTNGLEIYYQRLIHSVWVEKEHYLKENTRVDHFLETRSVEYLSKNQEDFLDRILSEIYN